MTETDPRLVALALVERINAGDVAGICALLTEDLEFIDTADASFRGRENLREGWVGYFQLFPDYRINVADVLVDGASVTLVGDSTGTLSESGARALRSADGTLPPEEELQGSAIWTAHVENGLVAQWRVYDDTAAVRASLGVA